MSDIVFPRRLGNTNPVASPSVLASRRTPMAAPDAVRPLRSTPPRCRDNFGGAHLSVVIEQGAQFAVVGLAFPEPLDCVVTPTRHGHHRRRVGLSRGNRSWPGTGTPVVSVVVWFFQERAPCAGWAAMTRRSHGRRQALLDDVGVDWLGVAVSRSDVENGDISATLGTLSDLLDTDATVRSFRGRVNVSFDGFNDDPREIYEIPEIRRFCAELDARFPYWLYFLSTEDSSLKMMTFCLCRVEKQGAGLVMVNNTDLGQFLYSHFAAMNELFRRHSLDEATNRAISDTVLKHFDLA